MLKPCFRPLLIAALLAALPAAFAEAPESEGPDVLEFQLAAAAQPGDALSDHLLAQALQKRLNRDADAALRGPGALHRHLRAERERLQARADAAMDADAFLLGLRLDCRVDGTARETCDARRARLATLDTGNAYHAVLLMIAAWTVGDEAGFLQAAERGAAATRYEPVFPRALHSLGARFEAVPAVAVPGMPAGPEGLPRGQVAAMAMTAAVPMPAFQWFTTPCREATDALRRHCRAIALRMLDNEGSALDAYFGVAVLEVIGEPAEQDRAKQRRRELDWLQRRSLDLMSGAEGAFLPGMADYFRLYGVQGELPALRHVLAANGVAVLPPEDWDPGRGRP